MCWWVIDDGRDDKDHLLTFPEAIRPSFVVFASVLLLRTRKFSRLDCVCVILVLPDPSFKGRLERFVSFRLLLPFSVVCFQVDRILHPAIPYVSDVLVF